jgi:hypothetical protein
MQATLRQAGISLALLTALAGCDHLQQSLRELDALANGRSTASTKPPRSAPVASRKVPKPAPRPAVETPQAVEPILARAPSPEPDVERSATRSGDRALPELAVVGLTEAQLQSRLGRPAADEPHAPGRVWRYRGDGCTVSLSLYPDVRTKVFRTLAYEVISDDNSAERKRDCLEGFSSNLAADRDPGGGGAAAAGGSGAVGDGR